MCQLFISDSREREKYKIFVVFFFAKSDELKDFYGILFTFPIPHTLRIMNSCANL